MFYIQKGFKNSIMHGMNGNLTDYLKSYDPPCFNVDDDNIKQVKESLEYAYVGRLKDGKRGNDSIISRDIIALDLDNIATAITTREELENALENVLGRLNYVLYPTIKNGLKGLRYRLLINTPPLLPSTYETVAKGFIYWLIDNKVIGDDWDESGARAAQLFSLPVSNQFSILPLVTYHDGEKLDASTIKQLIPEFKKMIAKHENKDRGSFSFLTTNSKAKRGYGALLMENVINGIHEGERNNTMNKIIYYWLKQGMNENALFNLITLLNSAYFQPSLSDEEIAKIFRSAVKGVNRD